MLYLFVPLVLLLLIYHYTVNWKKYVLSATIPGELPLPFVGNLPQLMFKSKPDIVKLLIKLGDRDDPLFRVWLGSELVVVCSGSEDIKIVLNECINRASIYEEMEMFFGHGLLNLREGEWKERRRLLNPSLSGKIVSSFQSIFNREADRIVLQLDEGGKSYLEIIDRSTMINIFNTTMGVNLTAHEELEFNKYLKIYPKLTIKAALLMKNPFIKWNPFYKETKFFRQYKEEADFSNDFLAKVVREGIRKTYAKTAECMTTADSKGHLNFIEQMLSGNANGGTFTEEDIINESKTLIVAGHETSVISLVAILLMLAQHKDTQQRLYEELMEFVPMGDLSPDQCRDLLFLDCVIKETLRLFPTLPLMTREVSQPITLSGGRQIPTGTQVMVSAIAMQRSKKYWGETANQFKPERFLPENVPGNSSNIFIPFAGGVRTCIGMRYAVYGLKVNLVKILRNFELSTELKFEEIVCEIAAILHFKNAENVSFRRRNSCLVQ